MKRMGLALCQLRSSTFHFIGHFPPKESMKEFVENRGRHDETGPSDKHCRYFRTVGTQPIFKHRHSAGYPPNVTNFLAFRRASPAYPEILFKNSCALITWTGSIWVRQTDR
jgi:hypothetical protein